MRNVHRTLNDKKYCDLTSATTRSDLIGYHAEREASQAPVVVHSRLREIQPSYVTSLRTAYSTGNTGKAHQRK